MCSRQEETGQEWYQPVHNHEGGLALEQSTTQTTNHLEYPIYRLCKEQEGYYFHTYIMSIDIQDSEKNKLSSTYNEETWKIV